MGTVIGILVGVILLLIGTNALAIAFAAVLYRDVKNSEALEPVDTVYGEMVWEYPNE